ncbi:hypothetical protein IEZ26_17020 [Nocardioides cavernae]|uniref:Peptidase M4 family protein n=1 Tax=Nocardioides cavernae TaxID=1921566 RepID=A0ABR8NDW6_9ACTN|nr:hypothetical protein [Nocardioides cavernae]MBD3926330.1 hypothetical protein [Nocardioides cavernae]MBM7513923.1 hypothetical protein [Nocardioides cavernae]
MPGGVEFTESADTPRSHIALRIIAQDPSVKGDDDKILTATVRIPWSRMEDGPRGARLHVVDFDASTGRYLKHPGLPNDDEFADAEDEELETSHVFHAQQVYAAASRTLSAFESALGRRLAWGFNGHHLYLVPHAFAEANAYYSFEDRALLFGYVPGDDETVTYTCLSYDVVVHETTHALLDGLRRRFLEPGLPDQAAFHEGFADIVALLSVFSMHPVVEQALGKADKNGRIKRRQVERDHLRSGVLTGVAEQLGKVLTQGRGALRRSAMTPPPPDWAELPQYEEPHRRGEVLVAIVLDVLLDIWVKRLEPLLQPDEEARVATLDRARAAEEGARAAAQLLTMMIRGLDYLPPVEFEFGDLLDAVLLADAEVVPDDDLGYRDMLIDRFDKAGVERPRNRVTNVVEAEVAPHYLGFNFAALRSDRDEVFRFLWQNAQRLDVCTKYYTVIESVRPSQRVGPDGLIVPEFVATYVQMLDLSAGELRQMAELATPETLDPATPVQLLGGGTLVFDQFGRLKLHIHKNLDDWRRQLRRLEYLHRTGRYDTDKRLGFSEGAARGQAFAELHNTELGAGEAW